MLIRDGMENETSTSTAIGTDQATTPWLVRERDVSGKFLGIAHWRLA